MFELEPTPMPREEYEQHIKRLSELWTQSDLAWDAAKPWNAICQWNTLLAITIIPVAGLFGIVCTLFSATTFLTSAMTWGTALFVLTTSIALLTWFIGWILEGPARKVAAELARTQSLIRDRCPAD